MEPLHYLEIAAIILAAIVALILAGVYLASRWRRAAEREKDAYIEALRESKDEAIAQCERAEIINHDLEEKNRLLENRVAALEAKVCMLQDLVLRQCRDAEKDPQTGACRYCSKGRWYGQAGEV